MKSLRLLGLIAIAAVAIAAVVWSSLWLWYRPPAAAK